MGDRLLVEGAVHDERNIRLAEVWEFRGKTTPTSWKRGTGRAQQGDKAWEKQSHSGVYDAARMQSPTMKNRAARRAADKIKSSQLQDVCSLRGGFGRTTLRQHNHRLPCCTPPHL